MRARIRKVSFFSLTIFLQTLQTTHLAFELFPSDTFEAPEAPVIAIWQWFLLNGDFPKMSALGSPKISQNGKTEGCICIYMHILYRHIYIYRKQHYEKSHVPAKKHQSWNKCRFRKTPADVCHPSDLQNGTLPVDVWSNPRGQQKHPPFDLLKKSKRHSPQSKPKKTIRL